MFGYNLRMTLAEYKGIFVLQSFDKVARLEIDNLTYLSRMEFLALINWLNPFRI